ncbi:hypothetical protein EJV47_22330 [Hymenobacter gummosus]|uniref:Uncharacterized protein n=1 Tax=Hymenobacter gummosus TaxID=1776032 RepID=A0A3S0JB95_9BACT|nr:hypothetical protein [Hymenobacter gummosus]RTQ46268.1 hypothetical protein EJV47_22330 [Hymenobacter gummosus]
MKTILPLYGPSALLLGLGLLAAAPARAQQLPASADTVRFPVRYCTALPSLQMTQWDDDYSRYQRWLTPEIRKTQMGMSYQREGVQTWWCRPSASPHAQLDTATVVRDAGKLQGNWRVVANRVITHLDSVSFTDKRIYRTARLRPNEEPGTLQITDQKFSLTDTGHAGKKPKTRTSNYELINQRYLLLYRGSKAGGAVSQVGLDAAGRLVLHNCGVEERKVNGRYIVYQTVINQVIFERQ